MSGVSKRLFMALSDLRATPPQLEDALFQMASVIDSTSKHCHPHESSSNRFRMYLESVATDVYRIATSGKAILVDCTFLAWDGKFKTFGQILYEIRCSSYHDPNEVNDRIHWGEDNQLGVNEGRLVVTRPLLLALFMILITDEANEPHIDLALFDESHTFDVNGKPHPIRVFVGNRKALLDVLGLDQ